MNRKKINQKRRNRKVQRSHKETLREHLAELRERIGWSVGVLVVGGLGGYWWREKILGWLMAPLKQPLFYTSPAGGLNFSITLALFFGGVVFWPFFGWQVYRFVEPAFPQKKKSPVIFAGLGAGLLMLIGIAFAYYISLPLALGFLAKFGDGEIRPLISANEYLAFAMRYLLGFGVLFQLPLILLLVNEVKPLRIKGLWQFQRWVILISFTVAAIITPTSDFFNQAMMAVPMIILYQISLIAVWIANKKKGIFPKN